MFGYIRPYKSELLVREYEQYKAIYCELCRELGKSFGKTARFALSFDCTFYAMLALSVNGGKVSLHKSVCRVNPLKKCNFIETPGEDYKKAAALCVLMTYHKLRDNLQDEGFFKSLGSRLLLPFVFRKRKKAAARYPFLEQAVQQAMESQRQAEEESGGVDRCAEPTAQLLSEVFSELAGCEEQKKRPLEQFGYYLGRWVYLIDAADDLEDDLRSGAFNPLIQRLELGGIKELPPEKKKELALSCNAMLNATAAQMIPAFNLLDFVNFGPILENVIKKGIPQMQREILFMDRNKRRKEKV